MGTHRAVLRLCGLVLLSALLIPPQALACRFVAGRWLYVIPRLWHGAVCRMFGLRVRVFGQPLREGTVLYVSNHLSYLDIPVLGSLVPASFVAKKEVETWPFFGLLARLQKTAFVDRARSAARESGERLLAGLQERQAMILFPEGTSSDGRSVLPFRSSLFAALDGIGEVTVQPVTVRLEGAEDQVARDAYAWYGDMDLAPHLWAFAKRRGAQVHVIFHPCLSSDLKNRKDLARAAHREVAQGLDLRLE